MKARTIAILALPGVQLLDVSGPLDVFAEANVQAGRESYRLRVIATAPGDIRSSSGARLLPDGVIGHMDTEAIDTLLIAGSPNAAQMRLDAWMVRWMRGVASAGRRGGSVCSGAFCPGAGGWVEGKLVTTHWAVAEQLARA